MAFLEHILSRSMTCHLVVAFGGAIVVVGCDDTLAPVASRVEVEVVDRAVSCNGVECFDEEGALVSSVTATGWASIVTDDGEGTRRFRVDAEFEPTTTRPGESSRRFALTMSFPSESAGEVSGELTVLEGAGERSRSHAVKGVLWTTDRPEQCGCRDLAFDLEFAVTDDAGAQRRWRMTRGRVIEAGTVGCLGPRQTELEAGVRLERLRCPRLGGSGLPTLDAGVPFVPSRRYRDDDYTTDDDYAAGGCDGYLDDGDDEGGGTGSGCGTESDGSDGGGGCGGDSYDDGDDGAACDSDDDSSGCAGDDGDDSCEGDDVAKGTRRRRFPFRALIFPGLACAVLHRRSRRWRGHRGSEGRSAKARCLAVPDI